MPKRKSTRKKRKSQTKPKPFIEINVEIEGIQGIIEFFLGLNKYIDVGELLKKAYYSSSDLQRLVRYGMYIEINFKL